MADAAGRWDAARVAGALGSGRFGRPLVVRDSVGSTIDEAWEAAEAGAAEGWAVVAETQTRGRGRAGRLWHSPPGAGIWLSLVLRPATGWQRLGTLPLAAGVAVARACGAAGAPVRLKWPNDVVAPDGSGRKLSGLLAESRSSGSVGASAPSGPAVVVLSVGLNVSAEAADFPPELAGRAAALSELTGRPVDRAALLVSLLGELESAYDELAARGPERLLEEWRGHSAMLGRVVRLREGVAEVAGVARDVDADGALVVRLESGAEMIVRAGEVDVLWGPRERSVSAAGAADE